MRQKKFSIVLIEDNPADTGIVRAALDEHGVDCELVVLSDGEKAVRYIQPFDTRPRACPDLLIVDLNLPKRSGREVLQSVRLSVKCRTAPVVVLSSSDAQQDKEDSARLGANRYIHKPLHLEEFLRLGAVFKAILEAGDTPDR